MSNSKKGNKAILFLVLAIILVLAAFFWSKAQAENKADEMFTMATNSERVAFLNEQGWIVKPDPISKEEVTVPSVYEGIYADYAQLQKEQGFDLEKYQGSKVTIIKYQVLNYPDYPENVTATMMICDNRLIGGDISLETEDGFTEPLISETAQTFLVQQ
ncbi:MAG: DUF4830 domain-containing protein [Oscillospiraceae bacterium]|nr:DUF4830 domain-containing protein [Oscillospiraceae bacterium]